MKAEDKVLAVLDNPLTNIEIKKITGLNSDEVRKALRTLRNQDQIYSKGYTSARRHMRLTTAIDEIFKKLSEIGRRLEYVENNIKLR
ncbi:MAG: hypothetical protein SRB2_02836 [Desulfobacteraceae bacterium Eth-SRB2]|nr:MAG: hypothetical protein SRB2_02836 [Desulfobacteraceae bacterium Eth-SRB2]